VKLKKPGGVFDSDSIYDELNRLEQDTQKSDFWENRENTENTFTRISQLKETIEPWSQLRAAVQELKDLFELYRQEPDSEEFEGELIQQLTEAKAQFDELYIKSLLSEKFDANNAFLTIHSGAGGTEACDWVSMLLRMYLRWIEVRGFKAVVLDMLEAEGGIKSVTIEVSGKNSYGYLKGETGVHRLVRISPFDSNKRRHTSFSSVYVSPVIDDMINIDIRPEDIRVDTYRASGAGGQHVNKTDSAVRMTHIETGIVVQCQNERSQHKNRATAMKVLTSRLYEYQRQQQEAEKSKHSAEKKEISWGNQIRSYVFQPYTMVKDHRTLAQTGNIQAVMEGEIDLFIEAYLQWNMK
jgi:peptide chain release factor 2